MSTDVKFLASGGPPFKSFALFFKKLLAVLLAQGGKPALTDVKLALRDSARGRFYIGFQRQTHSDVKLAPQWMPNWQCMSWEKPALVFGNFQKSFGIFFNWKVLTSVDTATADDTCTGRAP